MKVSIYAILIGSLFSSCKISFQKRDICNKKVEAALISLSKSISYNKPTKVYNLEYEKLPVLSQDRFRFLSDSLNNFHLGIYFDYKDVQLYLYANQLKNLKNVKCKMTVQDIRKYFGEESSTGTNKDTITHLFYYFNSPSFIDCYNINAHGGAYSNCRVLAFKIDTNQVLTGVLPFGGDWD